MVGEPDQTSRYSISVSLGFLPACAAASAETENELDEDGEADDEDDEDEADHVQQVVLHPRELEGGGSGGDVEDKDYEEGKVG